MKKMSMKLSYDHACDMSRWIDLLFEQTKPDSFSVKCMLSVLKEWQRSKLYPLLDFRYQGTHTIKLAAPVSLALAHFIERTQIDVTTYVGNRLLQLLSETDQNFK